MVLAHEDGDDATHPYWYAWILGIFHASVLHTGPKSTNTEPQAMDFLWIRWFSRDLSFPSGWETRQLPRVGFLYADDPGAFAFLDPQQVIRAVHMIPVFTLGTTDEYLGPSIARNPQDNNEDWLSYYINM